MGVIGPRETSFYLPLGIKCYDPEDLLSVKKT